MCGILTAYAPAAVPAGPPHESTERLGRDPAQGDERVGRQRTRTVLQHEGRPGRSADGPVVFVIVDGCSFSLAAVLGHFLFLFVIMC